MELLFGLAVVAIVASPVAIGAWILHPLDRAARNRRVRARFTVLDVLGLCFLVQLPMTLLGFVAQDPYDVYGGLGGARWALYWMGWIASAMIWWIGVRTFSRAGIHQVWRRGLLVFVVLPIAYYGSFAIVVIALVLWFTHSETSTAFVAGLGVIEVGLILGVIFSGRFTRRIVVSPATTPAQTSQSSPKG